MTQPDIVGWETGRIEWRLANGITSVIQVSVNCNGLGPVYWWHNIMTPVETFRSSCFDFAKRFPFAAMGVNVVSAVAEEWGTAGNLLQSRQISFDSESANIFDEE